MKKVFVLVIALLMVCSMALADSAETNKFQEILNEPPADLRQLFDPEAFYTLLDTFTIDWTAEEGKPVIISADEELLEKVVGSYLAYHDKDETTAADVLINDPSQGGIVFDSSKTYDPAEHTPDGIVLTLS